jgi:hypothetical protein
MPVPANFAVRHAKDLATSVKAVLTTALRVKALRAATLRRAVISHLGLTLVLPVATSRRVVTLRSVPTSRPGSPPRASLRVSLNPETVEKCLCRVTQKSGLRALRVKRLKA